ncbi:MAG: TonB C-terminal domain-containing protein [bacterium]
MCAIIVPFLPSFQKQPVEIVDMTVVLDENTTPPAPQTEKQSPKQPPKADPNEDVIEPEPLKKLPDPIKDAIILEKKKEKEKEKLKDHPKPKDFEKPKEFKKGERVSKPIDKSTDKPKNDFTKLRPVTEKQLSPKEIANALASGAKPGIRNQLPSNEISLCVSLVKNALYDAWDQPGQGEAGSRPAKLYIRLDASGRIMIYRISQSSGSIHFDTTVLKAAANCPAIRGLSVAFLKEHEELTIEFKLE